MSELIQIEKRAEVDEKLAGIGEHVGDMRRLAPALSSAWYARVRGWLGSSGRGTFPGLTEAYAREKAKRYGDQPILTASGAMAAALTGRETADSVYIESAEELTLGATGRSGEIAALHQAGTDTMPSRPPYDSLLVEEFKREDVGPIMVADLTDYAASISLRVQV